ncbi:hypothetical protein ACWGMW_03070 [Streptomyces albidoflavus]
METTSRVPEAVDALLDILSTAPALEAVRVVDGPLPVDVNSDPMALYIGYSRDGDQAVSLQQSFAGAGARTRDEEFSIACLAVARGGDKDMVLYRRKVFEMVAVVEAVLRATNSDPTAPTLGGTVLWSELTAGGLTQDQDPDGPRATLAFTVSCRARI